MPYIRFFYLIPIILLAVGLVSLAYFFPSPVLFIKLMPLSLFLTVFLAMYHLLKHKPFLHFIKTTDCLIGLGLGLVLTTCLFLAVTPEFRILMDEAYLISTSLSLFEKLQFSTYIEAIHGIEGYEHLNYLVPHRPGLFSTLVSGLHFIFGYNPNHGFAVNFLVSVFSLALFYWLGSKISRTAGVLAALFLFLFPIYQLDVTSAGFDALNMLMLAVFFTQLYFFLKESNIENFQLLLLAGLLAAQCRYESAIVILPLLVVLLMHRSIFNHKISATMLLVPLLYVPVAWQKFVSSNFASLHSKPEDAFRLSYLFENSVEFFRFFITNLNSSPLIFMLAFLGFYYVFKIKNMHLPLRITLLLCALTYGIITIAQLTYQYGNFNLGWTARFSHVHLLWIVPFAVFGILHFVARTKLIFAVVVLLFGYSTFAVYHHLKHPEITVPVEYKISQNFLRNYNKNETLVISSLPALFTILGYSSIGFEYPKDKAILLESDKFTSVVAIDSFQNERWLLSSSTEFSSLLKHYPFKELLTLRTAENSQIRFMEFNRRNFLKN